MRTASPSHPPRDQERDALRLAVELLALVVLADSFCEGHAPIEGDAYVRAAWARRRLAPVALRFPSVGRVVYLLAWERARGWLQDGRQIRKRLDVLAREIGKLGKAVRS